jgi:predicted transposase YdaD
MNPHLFALIEYEKNGAILKERGFTLEKDEEQEMKTMEYWSKGIFESMRDDIAEEVKREAREEGREEGRLEGRLEGVMLIKKVNHLLAKGMSDEEILKALPDVTAEFVKDARESYEEDHQLSRN